MVTQSGCVGWFKQRSNLEKTLLTLSCLLLPTLLIVILVGAAFKGTDISNMKMEDLPGCWNTECIKSAGGILSSLNRTSNPCTDFYEYACGRYDSVSGHSAAQMSIDNVYLSIKEHLESPPNDQENFNSIKMFYASCMRFGGLHTLTKISASEHLLQLMTRFHVGRWPVLDDFYETTLTLDERLASLSLLGVPVAFKTEVVPSSKIEGSYALKISPGGPLEAGRTATEIRGDHDLKTYMLFTFLLLGTSTNTKPNRTADEIRTIDAYYANIEQDTETNCDTRDYLSPEEALKMLGILIPEVDWNALFNLIRKEAGLKKSFPVELHCKAKIKDYINHLKDQFDGIAQDYLGWRFYESFAKHIEPAPQRSLLRLVPRWKECVRLVEQYAGPTLMRILIQDQRDDMHSRLEKIITHSLEATKKLISNTKWLKPPQKEKLLRQVEQTVVRTPYPKRSNTTELDRTIPFPEINGDYTAVVIERRRQLVVQQLRKLDLSVNEGRKYDIWLPLTSELNSESGSSLTIHLDEVNEPFFRLQGPDSWNYGSLGTTLAAKFSQMLITEKVGASEEDETSIWDLWSSDSMTSSCLLNSLSKKFDMNASNRSEKFLSDVFVDETALEIALESSRKALKSGPNDVLPGLLKTSDEKMFFLAYAQSKCEAKGVESGSSSIPIRKRVNAVLSNSKAFSEAFGCSSSKRKCPIWA